jgi:hypothetical protein
MNDRYRLKQLHVLKDRLERMPASPKRDWMLKEVRTRSVDVETGVRPRPIRPLESDDAPIEAATIETDAREIEAPKRRDTTPSRTAPARPRVAAAVPFEVVLEAPVKPQPRAPVAASDDRLDLLEHGGVLCLGDPPPEEPDDADHAGSSPWVRGLRG